MTLRDFLRKLFAFDPPPGAEEMLDSEPPPPPDFAREPSGSASNGSSSRATVREKDPLSGLASLPDSDAVSEALRRLDVAGDRTASLALSRWLHEISRREDLSAKASVALADWLVSRGESVDAERMLQRSTQGDPSSAAPVMMRLGDLAVARGDSIEAARWFERTLGIDLEFAGAREKRLRYARPTRAGDAGATLIAPDARVGIDRFALVRELGRGGAGAVFLATDEKLAREVAIKIYHPQARSDRGVRLRGEARVAAAVASSHVVCVHALYESLGAIVMEYFSGGSLRGRIGRGAIEPGEARRWAHEVALALAKVHSSGWVHRDLKPGNVLLRGDGRAVLTDFGLARSIGAVAPAMEGTEGYLAPEAREGVTAEPSQDVFAFGVLAKALGLGNDPRLGAVIERCVAVDPRERPRDGAALVELTR